MKTYLRTILSVAAIASLTGCTSIGNSLNPFQVPEDPRAKLGDRNDHALNQSKENEDTARKALEQMSSYRRTQQPQPNYPVMQPSVVRLMWIPDHLNSHGDMVPSHYYYLKVLKERWAVQDAFELESQLGDNKADPSNLPYVYSDDKNARRRR
ncbi:MAG: hypothetical protein H6619_06820 [Deltaproteobacteria bacterium]|nr:hypothetical protein [Deltaproteobacteria bacterium]